MRILRVAQDIFPETVGGAPYHIHALSRDQAANGHDVTVLTVSEAVDTKQCVERDGYTLVRHPPKLELLGNQLFTNTIGYLRNANDYDVVHAHSHLFFSSNVAAMYCRFSDGPLAVTCHGLNSQRGPPWFSRAHLRTLGKWTYDTADVTFCYTEVERSRLRELGVDSDIRVVRNGVDTSRFCPSGPRYPAIDAVDGPAVVFVGRLVDGKRPQDALAAFETVHEANPEARLFFCGDGPLRNRLERAVVDADLSDAVVFLDRVPYDAMPTVFRAADVFVLPSRTEGFPRTVMEALACGTPVVSSRLEQTAEVVEQAGETVAIGDVAGLADAVSGLLGDRRRLAALGRSGRRIVTEKFDWRDTVRQTTRVLRRVAEDGDAATQDDRDVPSSDIPLPKDGIDLK